MTESILPPEGQIYSKAGTDEAIAKAIGSGSRGRMEASHCLIPYG